MFIVWAMARDDIGAGDAATGRRSRFWRRRIAALAILVGLVGLLLVYIGPGSTAFSPEDSTEARFDPQEAPFPGEQLLDLGVTDYDGDGRMDLFTTNHKSRSVLLENRGDGGFTDVLAAEGLSPSKAFPGLEYLKAPEITEPGLYIYFTDPRDVKGAASEVHIRSEGVIGSGSIEFAGRHLRSTRNVGADVAMDTDPGGRPTMNFVASRGGKIDLAVRHLELGVKVELKTPEPQEIKIGSQAIPATSKTFEMTLRDRHGLAWADLGGNAGTDLFIARGGAGGGIRLPGGNGETASGQDRPGFGDLIQDELFIQQGGEFADERARSGLQKGDCAGRRAAAVDVNGDGLIDLFEGCDEVAPKIYLQQADGSFDSLPAPRSVATTYRWADLDGDGQEELLASEADGIRLYRFDGAVMEPVQLIDGNAGKGGVQQLALADLENDGDLDVLAVAESGNTLLRNDGGGKLRTVPLRSLGLPGRSVAASFVDYDNDGLLDLHLVPQGLMHRTGEDRFEPTGELTSDRKIRSAITNWFDLENDGLRDLAMATANSEFANQKDVRYERNRGPGGHWLEVDLDGPKDNPDALGARVAVKTGGAWQYGFVGQSDDARFSQGHYRLYFGLGESPTVEQLKIRWPDGSTTREGPIDADQVVEPSRSGS